MRGWHNGTASDSIEDEPAAKVLKADFREFDSPPALVFFQGESEDIYINTEKGPANENYRMQVLFSKYSS